MSKKIWGIVNGGGDAPGINAVIASLVKYGTTQEFEFIGFFKGWEGLLDKKYQKLDLESVRGISHSGGTILKTVNKGRFSSKVGDSNANKIQDEILQESIINAKELGIEGFFVIGGDGTQSTSAQLIEKGLKIIGIPKTIDNDLPFIDLTFGFSTAVDIAAESMQRLQTTATSHDRVFLVETMGRNSGWITLFAGLAGGADAIILPEFDFDEEKFISHLLKRKKSGRAFSIVALSEGVKFNGKLSTSQSNSDSEYRMHGIAETLETHFNSTFGDQLEFRSMILGHLQRGGVPNYEDMIISKRFGVAAIDAALQKDYGKMISISNNKILCIPISSIMNTVKKVNLTTPELILANKLGIFTNSTT